MQGDYTCTDKLGQSDTRSCKHCICRSCQILAITNFFFTRYNIGMEKKNYLKTFLVVSHDHITLAIQEKSQGWIRFTENRRGEKVTGPAGTQTKELLFDFARIMRANGIDLRTRFSDLEKLAKKSATVQQFVIGMREYQVPLAPLKTLEELMFDPKEQISPEQKIVTDYYKQGTEEILVRERFSFLDGPACVYITDNKSEVMWECPLFAFAKVKEALSIFCKED